MIPKLTCTFGIFLFVGFSLSSEEVIKKYIGPLGPSEKRIQEGKEDWAKTGNFPTTWRLYFKGKFGDFAVFYDLNGDEIHFRYRRNKFDEDGIKFADKLVAGNVYEVKGEWLGYYFYPMDERKKRTTIPKPKNLPAETQEFIDKQTIPLFRLVSYQEVYTDNLYY